MTVGSAALSPRLIAILKEAMGIGVEVTLAELGSELLPDGQLLEQLDAVVKLAEAWGLVLLPGPMTGNMLTSRVLRASPAAARPSPEIDAIAELPESSALEFKSSLLYDHDKAKDLPGLPLADYRSEGVLIGTLKTLAAFLNSGGGRLVLGVSDNREPVGLAEDCHLLGLAQFDADRWELELRNQAGGKLLNGGAACDHLHVRFAAFGKVRTAVVDVVPRRRLTFLRKGSVCTLYRRQGNRSLEVPIQDVEEFLEYRQAQGWCK